MKLCTLIAFMFNIAFAQFAIAADLNFITEVDRAALSLNCGKPIITRGDSQVLGDLYGCIVGSAQTVKFFLMKNQGQAK